MKLVPLFLTLSGNYVKTVIMSFGRAGLIQVMCMFTF